jgi:hypothetical protein
MKIEELIEVLKDLQERAGGRDMPVEVGDTSTESEVKYAKIEDGSVILYT